MLSALLLAILIKSFLIQAFFIPSSSMEPTLRPGDRILVCRNPPVFSDVTYGDVIVFSKFGPPSRTKPGGSSAASSTGWGRGSGSRGRRTTTSSSA